MAKTKQKKAKKDDKQEPEVGVNRYTYTYCIDEILSILVGPDITTKPIRYTDIKLNSLCHGGVTQILCYTSNSVYFLYSKCYKKPDIVTFIVTMLKMQLETSSNFNDPLKYGLILVEHGEGGKGGHGRMRTQTRIVQNTLLRKVFSYLMLFLQK